MGKQSNWSDEYFLLLFQMYRRKPVGIKPMYSKAMVDLGIELHVHPSVLHARMCDIDARATPQMQRLWDTYGDNARRLTAAVKRLRDMSGFCNAAAFYEGVGVSETFESDFRPVCAGSKVTPVMLIMIVDLYFRLTPATMVADTPEVADMARLLGLTPAAVTDVLRIFQHCDPYLNRQASASLLASPLVPACKEVWQRFGNDNPESLAAYAEELKEYFG